MSGTTTVQLSSPLYDKVKWATTVVLPGVGALYFTIAQIVGLPAAEEVVGVIAAVNVFLGGVLNVSSHAYNNSDAPFDGVAQVTPSSTGGKTYGLILNDGPESLEGKTEIRFKVDDQTK